MWAELKIQEGSIAMAHRWLFYFPQQLCSISPGSVAMHSQEPAGTSLTVPFLSKVVVGAAVSGNTWHYWKDDIYWHNQNILQQSNPHSQVSSRGENKVLYLWFCVLWFTSSMCMHKLRSSTGATAATSARSHETLNCTKATALAWEEDCQPCTLDTALKTLLPVEHHSSLLKYPSSARWSLCSLWENITQFSGLY